MSHLLSASVDCVFVPPLFFRQGFIHLDVAISEKSTLLSERSVTKMRVVSRDREVPRCMEPLGIDAVCLCTQLLTPILGHCLRHDVLDGDPGEVGRFLVTGGQFCLQRFEDGCGVRTPVQIEAKEGRLKSGVARIPPFQQE
ncbi:MAG: hypothetical protein DLM70_17245 [Chloroflexi bacterium]|nr:MAG: hypothetical protein DLM70_17245 [Chloroflexota bacterium]